MSEFRKLKVWQKAHELALNCQRAARRIRGSDYAALRSQMIRASSSIPANVVEGRAQISEKEFRRFLSYAIASTDETEYHLIVARDFDVLPENQFDELLSQLSEVRKMLYGLRKRLQLAS